MKKTSLGSIQKMLYKTLKEYKPLRDEVDGIFTDSVKGDLNTYVKIGSKTVNDWSNWLFYGEEATSTIHIWDIGSMYHCEKVMGLVIESLTDKQLIMEDGFYLDKIRLDFLETMEDPENFRHGVVRFRFLISQEGKGV